MMAFVGGMFAIDEVEVMQSLVNGATSAVLRLTTGRNLCVLCSTAQHYHSPIFGEIETLEVEAVGSV
jgi:hypothetical protein